MGSCKKIKKNEDTSDEQILKTFVESTESLYKNFGKLQEYLTSTNKNEELYSFYTYYLTNVRNPIICRITALKILNVTLVSNPENLKLLLNKGLITYAYKLLKRNKSGFNKKHVLYFGHNPEVHINLLVVEAKYLFTIILNIPLKEKSREAKFIKSIFKKITKQKIDISVYRDVRNSDDELKYELENYKLELVNLLENDDSNYYKIDYTFSTYTSLIERIKWRSIELLENGEYKTFLDFWESTSDEDEIKVRYESHVLNRRTSTNEYKRTESEMKQNRIEEKGDITNSKLKFIMNSKFFEELIKKNTSNSSICPERSGSLSKLKAKKSKDEKIDKKYEETKEEKKEESKTNSICNSDNFSKFDTTVFSNECDEPKNEGISKECIDRVVEVTSQNASVNMLTKKKDTTIREENVKKKNDAESPESEEVPIKDASRALNDNADNNDVVSDNGDISVETKKDSVAHENLSEKIIELKLQEEGERKQKQETRKTDKYTRKDSAVADKVEIYNHKSDEHKRTNVPSRQNMDKHIEKEHLEKYTMKEGRKQEKQDEDQNRRDSKNKTYIESFEGGKKKRATVRNESSSVMGLISGLGSLKDRKGNTSGKSNKGYAKLNNDVQNNGSNEFQNIFAMKDSDVWHNLIKKSNFYDIKEDFYNYYQFIKSKEKENNQKTLGDLIGMNKHAHMNEVTNGHSKLEETDEHSPIKKLNDHNNNLEKIMKTVGINTELGNVDSYEIQSDGYRPHENETFINGAISSGNGSFSTSKNNDIYMKTNFVNGIRKKSVSINEKEDRTNFSLESELANITNKMKKERSEVGSLSKYFTPHDNMKYIRNTILKDHSVLYDDDYCEIKIEQLYFGLNAILKIYIRSKKNITYHDVDIQVTNEVLFPLKIEFPNFDTSSKFSSSNCYHLVLKCLHVYKGFPSIAITFRMQDMLTKTINLRLPIPINKFMKKINVSNIIFKKFWELPLFDKNKKEKTFEKDSMVSKAYLMKNASLGNALSVCLVNDKIHLFGCFNAKSKEEDNSFALLTIKEIKNDKLEIICKSNDPILPPALLFLMIILFRKHEKSTILSRFSVS